MVHTRAPGTLDLQEQFGKINVQEAGIEPLPLHTTKPYHALPLPTELERISVGKGSA